jgi:hypothetical protein
MQQSTQTTLQTLRQGYAVIAKLHVKATTKAAEGTLPILQQQQYDELLHETEMAAEDLDKYRSHLAQLKTEAEFDAKELEELDDDTTKVISDWKMKILSCYFRENQGKFFGKRGTSLLGYMLIKNSSDPVAREKGLKDVKMVC